MSTPNQSGNPIQREEKGTASIDPGTTKNCGPSGEMTLAGSGAQSITPIKPLEGVSSLPGKSASNPTTPRTRTRRSSSYSVPSSSQQGFFKTFLFLFLGFHSSVKPNILKVKSTKQ